MKRTLALAAATLVLGTCLQGAVAQTPAPAANAPRPGAPAQPQQGMNIWDYQKQLGLTDEQANKIKGIIMGEKKTMQEDQAKGMKLEGDVRGLMGSEAEPAKVKGKLNEVHAVMIDMQMSQYEADLSIRKIMSPAQVTQWKTIVQSRQHPGGPAAPQMAPASPAPKH